jgi:hypothetical protein
MTIYVIIQIWSFLVAISLMLISFRKDSKIIYEDIESYYVDKKFIYKVLTIVTLYVMLPLSIPYSLAYFRRK